VAIGGKKMTPAEILIHLNKVGGENGIGRVDMVENRYVGIKSRGVYETPGGTILHAAHRAVESITMDREVMYLRFHGSAICGYGLLRVLVRPGGKSFEDDG
jgi:argininosuccinate synthase